MDDIYVKIHESEEISATEYFERLKNSKSEMTESGLVDFYNNCVYMKEQFQKTGQVDAMKKLIFLIETISKEKKCLDLGITTYVYKDKINEFISNVSKDEIEFIELERYERVIPEDITKKIELCKPVFDNMYVLFTDYSQVHKKKFEKECDPILFGTFEENEFIHDRFYYIGDWIDEYCDLTMEKFIAEYKDFNNENPTHTIANYNEINFSNIESLKHEINSLKFNENTGKYEQIPKENILKRFVGKIKKFFN